MRRVAWLLLLLFVFAIPWEYSVDFGEPLGNIARLAGVLALLAAIPSILQGGRIRTPGHLQWLTLAFFLFYCCSYLWTVDPQETLGKMRAYFQVTMIVWLVWEFAGNSRDLRDLSRCYLAGSWVLAILTLAGVRSAEAIAAGQIRFAAAGQDPNDVARFLNLGLPFAALLLTGEPRRWERLLALGYLPLGSVAVLLTASRGGFFGAMVAWAGCALMLARHRPRAVAGGSLLLLAIGVGFWLLAPHGAIERLATIPEQLRGGDLNQRWNIWSAGWDAFAHAPWLGSGAGTFANAAGLSPADTAHNTALAILVSGGLCGLSLFAAIVALCLRSILRMRGPVRAAMGIALSVWFVTSLVASVEENRTTWLLVSMIALAGRLAEEEPRDLAAYFSGGIGHSRLQGIARGEGPAGVAMPPVAPA
jgi:O-antigen ligase